MLETDNNNYSWKKTVATASIRIFQKVVNLKGARFAPEIFFCRPGSETVKNVIFGCPVVL